MDYTNKKCENHNRCGLFKQCEPCNRIRQARLCDVSELASRFSDRATYCVVMPFGKGQQPKLINKLKSNLRRKLRNSTNGLMTSIETSPRDALHINLIITNDKEITPKPILTTCKNLGIEADIFLEDISKNDIRNITAYALKRQSIPTLEQYDKNIVNLSGDIRTAKNIMQSYKMLKHNPLVAITSMNNSLIKMGLEPLDEVMLKTPRIQNQLNNMIFMINQLDKFQACYNNKRGLLTMHDFKKIYKQTLKAIGLDNQKVVDMQYNPRTRYRKLPNNITLSEQLHKYHYKR